ncbi:unnamed protein product, partial [Arabidopsis halleri]
GFGSDDRIVGSGDLLLTAITRFRTWSSWPVSADARESDRGQLRSGFSDSTFSVICESSEISVRESKHQEVSESVSDQVTIARSNRNLRRNHGNDENSANVAARDVNVVHEEVVDEVNAAVGAAGNLNDPVNVNNAANVEAVAAPVELGQVLGVLAQILARLPVVAPAPMVPPPVADPPMENVPPVANVVEEVVVARVPSYLKKDIAVHYLDGDAHTWWAGVAGRLENPDCSWETFCEEFCTKYFPPEAYDRLEGAFLDLQQGTITVREYEAEFNSLRKYAGRELEEEKVQVQRFMRGMRIELRNRCLVRNYNTVAELVEKAAMLELGLSEEAKLRSDMIQSQSPQFGKSGNAAGQKMKNVGTNWKATGACLRCGSMEHRVRDCPKEDTRGKNPGSDLGSKLCFNCNEPGHYKSQCPKLVQSAGKRACEGLPPPPKRQAVMPRMYSMI